MNGYASIAHLNINPEGLQQYMQASLENCRLTRETEPGCLGFHILVDPADPTKVTVCEIYVDEAAFKAHLQSKHFLKMRETAGRFVQVREREVLAVGGL